MSSRIAEKQIGQLEEAVDKTGQLQ